MKMNWASFPQCMALNFVVIIIFMVFIFFMNKILHLSMLTETIMAGLCGIISGGIISGKYFSEMLETEMDNILRRL